VTIIQILYIHEKNEFAEISKNLAKILVLTISLNVPHNYFGKIIFRSVSN